MTASTSLTHLTHLINTPLCNETDSERTFFVNELPVELIKLINSHIASPQQEGDLQSSFNFLFHASQVCQEKFPEQSLHFQEECEKVLSIATDRLITISSDEDAQKAKIKVIQSYIHLGNFPEVEKLLQEFESYLKEHPQVRYRYINWHFKLLLDLAKAYNQSNEPLKAEQKMEKARSIALAEEDDQCRFELLLPLAKSYAMLKMDAESEALFKQIEKLIQTFQNNFLELEELGEAYLELGKSKQAKRIFDDYQKCVIPQKFLISGVKEKIFQRIIKLLLNHRQSIPAQDMQSLALSFLQNCKEYYISTIENPRFICYSYARFGLYDEVIKIGNWKIVLDMIQDCIEAKDNDLALLLLAECEKLKIHDYEDKPGFLLELANAHIQLKSFDKAKSLLEMSKALTNSRDYSQQKYIDFAYAYFSLGEPEKAKSFVKALENPLLNAKSLVDLANIYILIGCFSEAKNLLQEAEQKMTKSVLLLGEEMEFLNIAKAYLKLGCLDEKERDSLLEKAKNIMKKSTSKNFVISSLVELAKASRLTDTALAKHFLQEALNIAYINKDFSSFLTFNCLTDIALGYADLQMPDQTNTCLQEAKEIMQNDETFKIKSLFKLVSIYIQLKDLTRAKGVLQEIEYYIDNFYQQSEGPFFLLKLIKIYTQLKDFSKVEELLEKADYKFKMDKRELNNSHNFLIRHKFIYELKNSIGGRLSNT
ncbi:MAG: hypothetical protein PVI40_04260 [Chlamydiota bacterium]